MARTAWLLATLLTVALVISGCASESTETPTARPVATQATTPTSVPSPVPTADLEAIVRRVLAESRSAETPIPTSEPPPTIDVEALAFEITERVLSTLDARETPTPEPTPEPTPTPTPTPSPTPSLPVVIQSIQNSLVRLSAAGSHVASGVVVDVNADSGEILVLTTYEKIAGVNALEATVGIGNKFDAEVSGFDEMRNVALIRLCCDNSTVPVPLGDSLTLQVGSEVAALERELQSGLGLVVSRGVVSAAFFDGELERWMIQTDASVSVADGGALITPDGRLIGLLVDSYDGFGYAVSELTLSEILPSLR